jgi:hypothetical protein
MATQLINVRAAFEARPGYVLYDIDYSQIENRLSAAVAGERPLLEGFLAGHDFYRMIFAQMKGGNIDINSITKTERQIGKVLVLGQGYGQGKKGAARQLKKSLEETEQILAAYWNGLPATTAARNEILIKARSAMGMSTWFGRWRPMPELFHDQNHIRAKAERQLWNFYIQGTAADWMKIAMLRCDRALAHYDVHLLLTVHDELLFEVSVKEPLAEVAWVIKDAMEFKVPDLPVDVPALYRSNRDLYPDGFYVPAEATWGFNWGEQHELEDQTKGGKTVKGFRTLAKERGLDLDFETFRDPKPDYTTPRRSRASRPTKPTLRAVETAAINDLFTKPLQEDQVDPFRYPCVVVEMPQLDKAESEFVKNASALLPGPDHLFLEYDAKLIDTTVQVDGGQLVEYLKKLPRVGSKLTANRFNQNGSLVKVSFR